ncbi:MAG: hypothetical protein J6Y69_04135 [Treponema sp.]|nr:hypothetical protein [Treponema sp.]
MKKTVKLIAASLLLSCTLLWGQASDFSDEALFGSSDDDFFFDDGIEELKTPENGDGLTASHGELFENGSVKIGGSFNLGLDTYTTLYRKDDGKNLGENIRDTRFAPKADAQISVDARPTQTLRMYTKFGINYPYKSSVTISGTNGLAGIDPSDPDYMAQIQAALGNVNASVADWLYVKELFSDFSVADRAFFRFGLHTVSWGTGMFFSPVSDMINTSSIDPENTDAQVNGSLNLRTQITFPDSQNCLWLYVIPHSTMDTSSLTDPGVSIADVLNTTQFPYEFRKTAIAAKADFVIGGWELGAGALYKFHNAPQIMATASGSIINNKVGVFGEALLRYGSNMEWEASDSWSDKSLIFQGTVGAMYMWSDPGITFMAQYYFDGNKDDDEYSTKGNSLAGTVQFNKIGETDLTASIFGLFYIGKAVPDNLPEAYAVMQSGRKYMPYQGIVSATMTWAPFDNFNFSFGPYITWLALSEAPEVALKLSCKLGGGKF